MKDINGNTIQIGDQVEMPQPNETDLHKHSFVGSVKTFREKNIVVEDSEGDCFEIEPERVTLFDEQSYIEDIFSQDYNPQN